MTATALNPVAESERLLPDGRIRDDRQIHPSARHGARGLRHHPVRQCGAAGRGLGEGARRRHADPRARRPQSSGQRRRHHRRRHDQRAECADARARAHLRQGGLSELSGAGQGRLSRRASMSAAGLRCSPRACRITTRPSGRGSTIRTSRPWRARSRAPSRPTSATRMCRARCCVSATCRGSPMPACIPART